MALKAKSSRIFYDGEGGQLGEFNDQVLANIARESGQDREGGYTATRRVQRLELANTAWALRKGTFAALQ